MFRSSIYQMTLLAMLASACSGSSSAPPPAPATNTASAAKSQDAASSAADPQKPSPLAKLSADGDGDIEVRDRQVGALKTQRDSFVKQLVIMQSFADQLFSTDSAIQEAALKSLAKASLSSAAAGSAIAIGGGTAVSLITGNWGALLATAPAVATMVAGGAAAESAEKKDLAASKAISADVVAQRDIVTAQIANLQTKIAALNAQIDTLNALKL
jgi:hypothetical protein